MNRLSTLLIGVFAAVLAAGGPAAGQQKRALVVGMDAYQNVPRLQKAVRDANTISVALKSIGFDVTTSRDATRAELEAAFRTFTGALRGSETKVAVVYVATHAVEIGGAGYLIAVDAPKLASAADLRTGALAVAELLGIVREAYPGPVVLVIDACRDNPFPRGAAGGPEPALRNVFVLFSASAGTCPVEAAKAEGDDKPSPFAEALALRLADPGLDVVALARSVQRDVIAKLAAAGIDQRPAYYDDLGSEDVFLAR